MSKTDHKREMKELYYPPRSAVVEVDVPTLQFLMVDGTGDPNTAASYSEAVAALYAVSYTVKFAMKRDAGQDYVVMPLEGLWWADDLSSFARNDRRHWQWTMMIMQPVAVSAARIDAAIAAVHDSKHLPGLDRLRFEQFTEGRCAQTLHIGPFSDEAATIQRLHDYIAERSALRGQHHEIYLSDIRRAAPERWKTVIRQPMV